MEDEPPQVVTKVRQSHTNGRWRTVEVERKARQESESGRAILHLPKKKKKKKPKAAPQEKVKPAKAAKPKKPKGLSRIPGGRLIPQLQTSKWSPKHRGGGWVNPGTLSQGMPGNEEED